MTRRRDARLLDAALGGDESAWREAWSSAERAADDAMRRQLLDAVDVDARRRLLAPSLVARLAAVANAEASGAPGLRARGRAARRLVELLVELECAPYVSRSRQWGDERVVHIGLCGAPSHMKLAPKSAAWDLVAARLCGNCKRALDRLAAHSR